VASVVIFDLDGTLVDSVADLAHAGNAARGAVGLAPLAEAAVARCVGDGVDRLIERLVPEPALRAPAKQAFERHYAEHCCDRTRPYPGIAELLARLAGAGWVLAVATNKPLAFTRRILAAAGIADRFAEVRGGDGPRKPDPGQLSDILRATGAAAARSWMVGDHHTDVRAGHAAGCRVLFCTWGLGHRDGLAADAEAARPGDIPALLGAP
jgi:phosphoglycolate phosphatase